LAAVIRARIIADVSARKPAGRAIRMGRRIRELRRERGLTQEQLGERAHLSYKFIGEIERGVANPTVATLISISEALNVDVAHLFEPRASEPGGTRLYPLSDADFDRAQEALESLGSILRKPGPKKRPSGTR
jgi:transcriptional regulator with XRE-family HTH domain